MFDLFLQYGNSAIAWLMAFSANTIAIVLCLVAFAFYVYAFINAAIPKFIIAPIVSILLMAATYLYVQQTTTVYQQSLCDAKFNAAQQAANDKELQAALQIKQLQNQLSTTLITLTQAQAVQKQVLADALSHPVYDAPLLTPTDTPPDVKIPPMHAPNPQIIIDAGNCLQSPIPSNVLRALNSTSK